ELIDRFESFAIALAADSRVLQNRQLVDKLCTAEILACSVPCGDLADRRHQSYGGISEVKWRQVMDRLRNPMVLKSATRLLCDFGPYLAPLRGRQHVVGLEVFND